MKLEQLIVQYLYKHKSVSLQEIGIFHIAPEIIIPLDSDKEFQLPADAISYQFNLKAPADEGLVDFIVQQTRKIKPLASSDLESYTSLNKQFLNIGKPLVIEGLGTLQKNQLGNYEFSQSNFFNTKTEVQPTELREKVNEEISFSTSAKKSNTNKNSKNWLMILVFIFFIVGAVALLYYLNTSKTEPVELPVEKVLLDTLPAAGIKDSSNTASIDSTNITAAPVANLNDGYSFKVVIKTFNDLAKAQVSYNRLKSYGHKVLLTTKDSINYQIKIPFTNSLADTSRIKDSLNKFYAAKTYIDLN